MGRRDGMNIVMTWPHCLGGMGGGTVGVVQIVRNLAELGARVSLLSVRSRGKRSRRPLRPARLPADFAARDAQRVAELRDAGIDVRSLRSSAAHYNLDGLAVRREVRSILAERPVDAAFGWEQEFLFLPRLLRAQRAVTGMFAAGWYEQHVPGEDTGVRNLRHFFGHRVDRAVRVRTLTRVDLVFAISEYMGERIRRAFGVAADRVEVVKWGVHPMFGSARREPYERVQRFLFYGSPDPRKGGIDTVRAFRRALDQGQREWALKVVWQHEGEVRRVADELGLGAQVTALGTMSQAELARELEWAQVAVLPSKYESFGLACAEAQASGVPVIAYDVGGVSEVVVDGETGWLVPSGDVERLAGAVLDAMRDPQRTRRMGLAGRDRVASQFSWRRAAEGILAATERCRTRGG